MIPLYTYTYLFFFNFFFPFRSLCNNTVPCDLQQVLIGYFKDSNFFLNLKNSKWNPRLLFISWLREEYKKSSVRCELWAAHGKVFEDTCFYHAGNWGWVWWPCSWGASSLHTCRGHRPGAEIPQGFAAGIRCHLGTQCTRCHSQMLHSQLCTQRMAPGRVRLQGLACAWIEIIL